MTRIVSMIQDSRIVLILLTAAVTLGIAFIQVSAAATSLDVNTVEEMPNGDNQTGIVVDDPTMDLDDTEVAQASKRVVTMQGTASSPGADGGPFQIIDLLPVTEDGRVYVGWLTFTATKQIMVAPMQTFEVTNETLAPDFGDLLVFPIGPNGSLFSPALMTPQYSEAPKSQIPLPETYSASVPFAGNGLSVGNLNGEQFLISYTLHAVTYVPEVSNNVASARTNETEVQGTRVSIVPGSAFLTDTAYDPNPVTVGVGENVTWVNDDLDPHTVTSGSIGAPEAGQEFDSGYMGPHRSFTHRFDAAGEYDYFCIIHPNMVGTVVVGEE
jgi:plastocyanin